MNKLTVKTVEGKKLKARLTNEQLQYLLSLAEQNGIEIKEKGVKAPSLSAEVKPVSTPIRDEHIIAISDKANISLADVFLYKSSFEVNNLEEVLEHPDVPQNIKSIVEGLL